VDAVLYLEKTKRGTWPETGTQRMKTKWLGIDSIRESRKGKPRRLVGGICVSRVGTTSCARYRRRGPLADYSYVVNRSGVERGANSKGRNKSAQAVWSKGERKGLTALSNRLGFQRSIGTLPIEGKPEQWEIQAVPGKQRETTMIVNLDAGINSFACCGKSRGKDKDSWYRGKPRQKTSRWD